MKQSVIYKIVRDDGAAYVGITNNLQRRTHAHRYSDRFKGHEFKIEILMECDSYKEAQLLEPIFIAEHGTFVNGLNLTKHGKGYSNSSRFTTTDFKFSENSRKKMSEKSRARGAGTALQSWLRAHPDIVEKMRKKHSLKTRGRPKATRLTEESIRNFYSLYSTRPSTSRQPGRCPRSGQLLSYERAFCFDYASAFGMSITYGMNLLQGKSLAWRPIFEETIASKS